MSGFRIIAVAGVAVLTGCATVPPSKNLVDARMAYERARSGAAADVEPEYVSRAQDALRRAERAHEDEPQSAQERHFAYLAHRKALLAIAVTKGTKARQDEKRWEDEYVKVLAEQKESAQTRARNQERRLQDAQANAALTEEELEQERAARQRAETQLANLQTQLDKAMATIGELSQVERKDNELVITLNGAVLFELGKHNLLPTAQRKLRQVARVIKEQQSGRQ
ncbi:MAG: DUF4398 domain-containing protein, partial [Myxococcota bacterium]